MLSDIIVNQDIHCAVATPGNHMLHSCRTNRIHSANVLVVHECWTWAIQRKEPATAPDIAEVESIASMYGYGAQRYLRMMSSTHGATGSVPKPAVIVDVAGNVAPGAQPYITGA
jgi:hypothetical protein